MSGVIVGAIVLMRILGFGGIIIIIWILVRITERAPVRWSRCTADDDKQKTLR